MSIHKRFRDIGEGDEFLMQMGGKIRWFRKTGRSEAVRVEGSHVKVINIKPGQQVSGVMSRE